MLYHASFYLVILGARWKLERNLEGMNRECARKKQKDNVQII